MRGLRPLRQFFAAGLLPMALLQDGVRVEVSLGSNCYHPDKHFSATVARSSKIRSKGLAGKNTRLSSNEGMLFIFDPAQQANFWMLNTYIDLDLGFFDRDGVLVGLHHMKKETDPTNPKKIYPSEKIVSFALETNLGSLSPFEGKTTRACLHLKGALPKSVSTRTFF